MKTISMKKFFSLLLCLCMLLSMNSTAFAADGEESTCSHVWDEGTVTTPATCTTDGVKTYSCTVGECGETKTEAIPAAHSWDEGTVTLEPTCIAEGVKTYSCTADGCDETKTEPIPATYVHNYVDGFCTNDGCNHEAECTKAENCPALSHEADCLKYLQGCSCGIKCAPGEIKADCEVCGAAGAGISYCQGAERVCICTDKCQAATGTEAAVISSGCPVCRLAGADFGPQCKGKKLPNATVSALGAMTLTPSEHNYMCWPSGDSSINRPLQIVVNFKANETLEECLQNGYSQWLCDFYLTLSNLSGSSITADGCYLAGNYGSYTWIVIPTDGLVLDNGVTYPVVSNYDATLNYKDICKSVKNFTAAIFVHPDILVANPDMVVTLQLRMTNPADSSDILTIGSPLSYSAVTLAGGGLDAVRASYGGAAYDSVGEAIEVAVDSGSDAQVSFNTDHELPAEDASDKLSLKMLLGAKLTVSGEVKLASVSGGKDSVVLKDADTVLTLSNKPEDGTVASGVENMMVKYEEKDGKHVYRLVAAVAKIGETLYGSLQEAIDAAYTAGGNVTIDLLDNISGTYTVKEKVGLYLTINGDGKTLTGKIKITALSDTGDNRRTTISGLSFADAGANVDFISSADTNHYPRLTVDGCSFTGNGSGSDVAVRTKSAYGLVISNCTGTKLHSFLQNTSGVGITVTGVTVTDSKSGLSMGTAQGITISGCNIAAGAGYGIRIDANTYNNNATISNNTVSAFIPVCVRDVNTVSNISFSGNTMTQTNTDGYWCVIGTDEYEENGGLPTSGLDKVFVSGLSAQQEEGVYGGVFAEASIGSKLYPTLREAIAAAKDGDTIKLLRDIELSSTLIIGDPNGAFNKIGITVDGSGKTLKAVGTGWDDSMWLVDVTYNAAISNLTIDGNNTGCKGLQFYTSNSSLTNAVIKNISADKWGYTDYALHSNASNVALSGVSLVDCKHGHIIVDIGSSTGRTESVINATGSVSGATVILNNAGAKATAAQDGLTVIKGTDAGIAGHILVYENGSYVLVAAKASIGSTAYPSVEAALAAAKDGDTVTLLTDAGDISVSSSITLDLNGNNLNGDITVAQGKTLSVSEEDLAAAGSLSFADSLGNVKIGDEVIGLEDGTLAATAAGLSVTPSGAGKSYVRFNDMFVGVPAGQSLTVNADGSAKIPAGGSVVFAGSFEVPVASESTLAANGTLTLYPAEVQNYGYGKVTVTYGESAKSETVFVPAGKSLTVKADKNGKPVYDSSAEEAPIVTAGSVEKPKLSITPSKKAFYKFGLGTLSFTCNGFCDTLDTVYVDGVGLNDTAYTIQRGSTIVKLKNDYLKTLALGDHTLKLTYADGQSVTATISIVNTPVTGDSGYGIFAAGMGISLMGMLCVLFVLKKKRANN